MYGVLTYFLERTYLWWEARGVYSGFWRVLFKRLLGSPKGSGSVRVMRFMLISRFGFVGHGRRKRR